MLVVLGRASSAGEDAPPLTKDNGPWLIQARIFRGPDAAKLAQILARELQNEHGLPTYIYRDDQKPYEEISVLVGNSKTKDEAKTLLKRVKRIVSKQLVDILPASLLDLKYARIVTNPLRMT